MAFLQGLHLIAILPDHELRFSRANDHDLIRLERFTLVTYKKRGNIKRPYICNISFSSKFS